MELIDREALKKALKDRCSIFFDGEKEWLLSKQVEFIINEAPAIISCGVTSEGLPLMDLTPKPTGNKTSDLICPLLKSKCIREKCVCFSTRDYDFLGSPVEPYGTCEYLKINLDYEKEGDS